MTYPPEKPESEWTDYPTILPCGCILNRCGSLAHQCETAHMLLYGSLEAQRAGDISLSHELAAEYDEHIDGLGGGTNQ